MQSIPHMENILLTKIIILKYCITATIGKHGEEFGWLNILAGIVHDISTIGNRLAVSQNINYEYIFWSSSSRDRKTDSCLLAFIFIFETIITFPLLFLPSKPTHIPHPTLLQIHCRFNIYIHTYTWHKYKLFSLYNVTSIRVRVCL